MKWLFPRNLMEYVVPCAEPLINVHLPVESLDGIAHTGPVMNTVKRTCKHKTLLRKKHGIKEKNSLWECFISFV
jgi:hypothetical protein